MGKNCILKNDFIAFLKEQGIPLKILNGLELYSAKQVAQICGLSRSTVFNWIDAGKIKPLFQLPGGLERILSILSGKRDFR